MSTKKSLSTSFWSRPGKFGPWAQAIRVPAGHDLVFYHRHDCARRKREHGRPRRCEGADTAHL